MAVLRNSRTSGPFFGAAPPVLLLVVFLLLSSRRGIVSGFRAPSSLGKSPFGGSGSAGGAVTGHRSVPPAVATFAKRKSSASDEGGEGDEGAEDSPPSAAAASSGRPSAPGAPAPIDPAKRAALDGVLHRIERSYGRGSIVRLGDEAGKLDVECVGSGSLTLDVALGGGGYPKGRVVEIYGPESSGKTTLALHAVAEAQRNGGTAAFIDAEHALDPKYASRLGVDVDNLYVCQPDSGEMALDVVDVLVRGAAVDVVVVDSVAALVPRAELEGDMSDSQIGLQARLMSKAMRKITGSLAMSRTTVIFINQLRSKVGVIYGSPEVTSGGNALKFYASVRIDTRRKEILPDNSGIRCKVKIVKNKIAPPFKVVNLDILFGSGIDRMGSTLDAALDLGVVERRGSWYAYDGDNVAQGRQNVVDLMRRDTALADAIESEVRVALSASSSSPPDGLDNGGGGGAAGTARARASVPTQLDDDGDSVSGSRYGGGSGIGAAEVRGGGGGGRSDAGETEEESYLE